VESNAGNLNTSVTSALSNMGDLQKLKGEMR
jgi:hypothetical protein